MRPSSTSRNVVFMKATTRQRSPQQRAQKFKQFLYSGSLQFFPTTEKRMCTAVRAGTPPWRRDITIGNVLAFHCCASREKRRCVLGTGHITKRAAGRRSRHVAVVVITSTASRAKCTAVEHAPHRSLSSCTGRAV